MKLIQNNILRKVSLVGREAEDRDSGKLLGEVCLAEGWDVLDCVAVKIPDDSIIFALKATKACISENGINFSHQYTEQEQIQKIQTQYAHVKDKLQVVKNKYPEIVDFFVELGVIPKEL